MTKCMKYWLHFVYVYDFFCIKLKVERLERACELTCSNFDGFFCYKWKKVQSIEVSSEFLFINFSKNKIVRRLKSVPIQRTPIKYERIHYRIIMALGDKQCRKKNERRRRHKKSCAAYYNANTKLEYKLKNFSFVRVGVLKRRAAAAAVLYL